MKLYLYRKSINGDILNGEDLIKTALSMYSGKDKEMISILRTEDGKPYTEDIGSVHFSVSHTGDLWSCAVSESRVGLDIQKMKELDFYRLALRFFAEDESRYIKNREAHAKEAFFDIWTRKEAYVKFTGKGIKSGLSAFSVSDGTELPENPEGIGNCFFKEIYISGEIKCAVCTEERNDCIDRMIWMN